MRRMLPLSIVAVVLILVVGLLVFGCGTAATTTTTAAPTTTTAASAGGPGTGAPAKFTVDLTGAQSVQANPSTATGTFILSVEAGPNGQFNISYELDVKDLVDVTAAHIHLGAADANGPVIVPLFTGPAKSGSFTGVLAQGALTVADLTGPMAGKTFADLTAAVLGGQTYVNVHTKANPNGEIRGQIIVAGAGTPNTTSGAVTTTTSGAAATTTSTAGGY